MSRNDRTAYKLSRNPKKGLHNSKACLEVSRCLSSSFCSITGSSDFFQRMKLSCKVRLRLDRHMEDEVHDSTLLWI